MLTNENSIELCEAVQDDVEKRYNELKEKVNKALGSVGRIV